MAKKNLSKKINLAIILPMYNEEENISGLFKKINHTKEKERLNLDIVVVNDGSQDRTLKILQRSAKKYSFLHILDHGVNKGFAQALKTGIVFALAQKYHLLIFMDADQTQDPADLPKFIKKYRQGYDYILGSRYVAGGKMKNVPAWRVFLSVLGNAFFRFALNLPIKDMTTGYRAVSSKVFKKIDLCENGFGIQLEGTCKAYAAGFKMAEVPIVLVNRMKGSSKFKYNFGTFRKYFSLYLKCHQWVKNVKKAKKNNL